MPIATGATRQVVEFTWIDLLLAGLGMLRSCAVAEVYMKSGDQLLSRRDAVIMCGGVECEPLDPGPGRGRCAEAYTRSSHSARPRRNPPRYRRRHVRRIQCGSE